MEVVPYAVAGFLHILLDIRWFQRSVDLKIPWDVTVLRHCHQGEIKEVKGA